MAFQVLNSYGSALELYLGREQRIRGFYASGSLQNRTILSITVLKIGILTVYLVELYTSWIYQFLRLSHSDQGRGFEEM